MKGQPTIINEALLRAYVRIELLPKLKTLGKFDIVIGIKGGAARSGLANFIQKSLRVKTLRFVVIKYKRRNGYNSPRILKWLKMTLTNKKVLLIDDGVCTMCTMRKALNELKMVNDAKDISLAAPIIREPYSRFVTKRPKIRSKDGMYYDFYYCRSLVYGNRLLEVTWH
jgi:hypoxanthine phosphoribosyltransferase